MLNDVMRNISSLSRIASDETIPDKLLRECIRKIALELADYFDPYSSLLQESIRARNILSELSSRLTIPCDTRNDVNNAWYLLNVAIHKTLEPWEKNKNA